MIEKQGIINLSCYSIKIYTIVVLSDTEVTFLEKRMQFFVHFIIVLCLYTLLHNQRSLLLNFLVFHTFVGISLKPTAFLLLIFFNTVSSSSSIMFDV